MVRAMSDRGLLVAVVDDEEHVRRALRRLCVSAGFEVETFASGYELLESIATLKPDCVVLDLRLPGLTGFEVMEQLSEKARHVPTVIVTGDQEPGAAERALAGHAFAYLEKPVDGSCLLDAIARAIRSHRARRARRKRTH